MIELYNEVLGVVNALSHGTTLLSSNASVVSPRVVTFSSKQITPVDSPVMLPYVCTHVLVRMCPVSNEKKKRAPHAVHKIVHPPVQFV